MSTTMTIEQVSERLGVGPKTVLTWIRSGELKALNVARRISTRKPRWRITEEAMQAFLAIRSTSPSPPVIRRRKRDSSINYY